MISTFGMKFVAAKSFSRLNVMSRISVFKIMLKAVKSHEGVSSTHVFSFMLLTPMATSSQYKEKHIHVLYNMPIFDRQHLQRLYIFWLKVKVVVNSLYTTYIFCIFHTSI